MMKLPIDASFPAAFLEEAADLLGGLESTLRELEKRPEDKELLSAALRVMRTIKGSAAMYGFDEVSAFTHKIESILAAVREGVVPFTKTVSDYTLGARDLIREMLDPTGSGEDLSARALFLAASFRESIAVRGVSQNRRSSAIVPF